MLNLRKSALLIFCATTLEATVLAQQIQVNKDNRTIAITATDIAKADAEVAEVHIGFVTYAPDAKTAYADASDISNTVTSALMKNGIAASAIQSDAQNISEKQTYQQQVPEPERQKHRFQVTQTWTISTIAKDAAAVLNTAVSAGANTSGQIDWDVKDGNQLQAQAAEKALRSAREIAEQMASGLHAQLGPLVYASNEAPAQNRFRGGNGGGYGVLATDYAEVKALSIIPQQVTKSATVYAVFALQ